jgi:hypothetical protein
VHGSGREILSQLQADVPDPLREDLPELLPARSVRDPTIGILFLIFVGEHSFKGSSLQVEMKDIGSSKGLWWESGEEELIDQTISPHPN